VKRNLFSELTEGFDALKAQRGGKRTLRTHGNTTGSTRKPFERGEAWKSSRSGPKRITAPR
jgi:hypothetical protein